MASSLWHRTRSVWAQSSTWSRDCVVLLTELWPLSVSQRRERILQLSSRALDTSHAAAATEERRATSNQAALTLVRWEKEVSLLRYHGILGYLREKRLVPLPSFMSRSSSTVPSSNPSTTESVEPLTTGSKPTVGKIAFMITASMRSELQETLHYSTVEIKSLTPLQASLILQHGVRPEQRDEQLPLLLAKHYEDEALHRLEMERQEKVKRQMPDATPSHLVEPLVAQASETIGTKWYQIIECKMVDGSETEETVVALYLHENEAELGRETHQYLADKRAQRAAAATKESSPRPASNFEIRQVYIK